jgi:flagellin
MSIPFVTRSAFQPDRSADRRCAVPELHRTAQRLTYSRRTTAAAIASMTTAGATLGAVKSRITLQKDFIAGLKDAIESGIGQLVDADMNEESTRLQALQVQAQLGIQALSIANQSSQNILSLFR